MTPEELDKARAEEAWRLWNEENGVTDEGHAVIAARLAREGWAPTPKPSPRVMAMREWLKASGYDANAVDAGICDPGNARSKNRLGISKAMDFLAGYAAAVKEAKVLVTALRRTSPSPMPNRLSDYENRQALTTYLTAIGDE